MIGSAGTGKSKLLAWYAVSPNLKFKDDQYVDSSYDMTIGVEFVFLLTNRTVKCLILMVRKSSCKFGIRLVKNLSEQ